MLHNLLPPLEKKAVYTEYRMRLIAVVLLLLTGAVLIGVAALLPTYFTLKSDISAMTLTAASISTEGATTTPATSGDAAVIAEVTRTLALFEQTLTELPVTEVIRAALVVRPDAITIRGVTYSQEGRTVGLEGVAATRDALVGYARTLEDTPLFGRVPLSLADFAKNTNIEFNLSFAVEQASSTQP